MTEIVDRKVVHDCFYRERFKYTLGTPVPRVLLSYFESDEGFTVSTYDVTGILPNSLITFHINHRGDELIIAGALGLDYFTVTYKKESKERWLPKIEKMIDEL